MMHSGNRSTTVLILLDAFRWDYLEPTHAPFLYSIASRGVYVKKLTPSLGFCERTEIFTGTPPTVSGNFTAVGYDPDKSPFAKFSLGLRLTKPLMKISLVDKVVRRAITATNKRLRIHFPPYLIPPEVLPLIGPTEDRHPHNEPGAFKVESVFDILHDHDRRIYYDSFTALGWENGDDDNRCRLLMDHSPDHYDFYLLYISQMDVVGHRFGPDSDNRIEATKLVDAMVQKLIRDFRPQVTDPTFIILGDHGMAPVSTSINAGDILHRKMRYYGHHFGKDYIIFLDSTMVRAWAWNKVAFRHLRTILSEPEFTRQGRLLMKVDFRQHNIPDDDRYGHMIWLADAGVVVYPDYFHNRERPFGMHGYDPTESSSQGFALVYNPKRYTPRKIQHGRLLDLAPTLCDVMDLPAPSSSVGKSILVSL